MTKENIWQIILSYISLSPSVSFLSLTFVSIYLSPFLIIYRSTVHTARKTSGILVRYFSPPLPWLFLITRLWRGEKHERAQSFSGFIEKIIDMYGWMDAVGSAWLGQTFFTVPYQSLTVIKKLAYTFYLCSICSWKTANKHPTISSRELLKIFYCLLWEMKKMLEN